MGVFSRMRDIIQSNINAMLEKAEDPEKLIKLMIQEMEDTLVETKAHCAAAMAECKKVGRLLEDARKHEAEWEERVELAVTKGRDDLAKEALLQRRHFGEQAASYEREIAECETIVGKYKDDIQQLESKLQAAREKHRTLVQRHQRARQSQIAHQTMRKIDSSDAFARFESFENRIERMEADAELVNYATKPSLEDAFKALDKEDDELDRELAAIKQRINNNG